MKLIKILNRRKNKNNDNLNYWGKFKCPVCLQEVERHLSSGKRAKSCGCNKNKGVNSPRYKHGESKTRLYHIWNGMISRCLNLNAENYPYYGGRGITICPEWTNDYTKFRDWALSNGYKDNLTIDRRNTNGNYEPSNCRWETQKEQQGNKRNNVIKSMEQANEIRRLNNTGDYTQKELAEMFNVSVQLINNIINNKRW